MATCSTCDLSEISCEQCIVCGKEFPSAEKLAKQHRSRLTSVIPSSGEKVITVLKLASKFDFVGFEGKFTCRNCYQTLVQYSNCQQKLNKIQKKLDDVVQKGLFMITTKQTKTPAKKRSIDVVTPKRISSPHPQTSSPKSKRFRKILFMPTNTISPGRPGSIRIGIRYNSRYNRTSVRDPATKTIIRALVTKRYHTAVNSMFKIKNIFRTLQQRFIMAVKREVTAYCKGESVLKATEKADLAKFSWTVLLQEARDKCPVLTNLLESLTKKFGHYPQHILVATIFSMVISSRSPKMKLVKLINGLVMYHGHVQKEVYTLFNRTGWCLSHSAILNAMKRLTADYDKDVLLWKDECKFSDEQDDRPLTQYSLVFDNLNFKQISRHHTSQKDHSHQHNLIHTMAVKHRIDFDLPDKEEQGDVALLPLSAFLMSSEETSQLRDSLKIITQRILTTYIPFLKQYATNVPDHLPHLYTEESKRKSTMVPLGVMDKDETKTKEMVSALEQLKKYVPDDSDQSDGKILLWGDGLSVERANDAQRARLSSPTKLNEFVPVNADWHEQVILLQDAFTLHYKTTSSSQKGTLFQLRNRFNWRAVTKDISGNINPCREFLEFVTSGFVLLAAMEILDMTDLTTCPESQQSMLSQEPDVFLDRLALAILDKYVFYPTNVTDTEEDTTRPCTLDPTVSSANIQHQHLNASSNVSPGTNSQEQDSAAGTACGFDGCSKVFAVDGMVRVRHRKVCPFRDSPANKHSSSHDHTYHVQQQKSSKEDYVLNYSSSVLHHGLLDMARHDAVRENDGERIVLMWKYDFLQFFHLKHTKYAIFAFDLQAQLQASLSLQKAMELKYNRTVNFFGIPGRNVPIDLALEFKNRELKEHLKRIGPNIEKNNMKAMYSAAKSLGTLGHINQAYKKACNVYEGAPDKASQDFMADIAQLVEELHPESLFRYIPGRFHESFKDFPANMFSNLDGRKLHEWMLRRRTYLANKQKLQRELQLNMESDTVKG